MSEVKQNVEKIEIDGDLIRVTFTVNKQDIVVGSISFYGIQENVKNAILPTIVDEIMKERKEEIKQQVLNNVNWAELVRSDIAKKVIQEAARGY